MFFFNLKDAMGLKLGKIWHKEFFLDKNDACLLIV